MKELMAIKSAMKRRRPSFKRQEFNKRIRLSRSTWRKPRGVDSKMREQRGGYRAIVKIGYGTPRKLRGRLASGLIEVSVSTINKLNALAKDQIAVIPRTLGNRRRLEILKEASKSKFPISNFKNIDKKIKEIESEFLARKKRRQELKKSKVKRLKFSKKPLKSDKSKNKNKKSTSKVKSKVENKEVIEEKPKTETKKEVKSKSITKKTAKKEAKK